MRYWTMTVTVLLC